MMWSNLAIYSTTEATNYPVEWLENFKICGLLFWIFQSWIFITFIEPNREKDAPLSNIQHFLFNGVFGILELVLFAFQLVGGTFDLENRFTIQDSGDVLIILELLDHCNESLKVKIQKFQAFLLLIFKWCFLISEFLCF